MLYTEENTYRKYIREKTAELAGTPLNMEPSPIMPSQVRDIEKTLKGTGVSHETSQGRGKDVRNLFRGAGTIQNFTKAASSFEVQNRLLKYFCELIKIQTLEDCGIILAPSKTLNSALKKYWSAGDKVSGYQGDFKDLCRCTLVCYNKSLFGNMLAIIQKELRHFCYGGKWRILDEGEEKGANLRIRDDTNSKDLGYTDLNVTLTLPHAAKIEVQCNIQATLYGKSGRPVFMNEACPTGMGQAQYTSMERSKRVPGGCGHVLYELWKEYHRGKKCNISQDAVRDLSRDYYDHLSGRRTSLHPENIVERLTELSKSEIWIAIYDHTKAEDRPAFRPGHKWVIGLRE